MTEELERILARYKDRIYAGKMNLYTRAVDSVRDMPVLYDGKKAVVMEEKDFYALMEEVVKLRRMNTIDIYGDQTTRIRMNPNKPSEKADAPKRRRKA